MSGSRRPAPRSRGFSIVELMVALALGLVLMAGLVAVFVSSSQANREFHRTSEQIENGRYAMDVLTNELHHAGFYGTFYRIGAAGAAAPDPCAVTDAAGEITDGMPWPVQGYDAPDFATPPSLAGTSCGGWLPNANLVAGSDVLAVRRASTVALAAGDATVDGRVYLQANPVSAEIQFGSGAAITAASKADGTAATILARDGVTAAPIRHYMVHVYFVAPCAVPAGGGNVCTGAGDDDGNPVPTLKRLELDGTGGATTMRYETIAEGIQSLQIDYGIDDDPAVVNVMTGSIGDGVPDRYERAPSAAEYPSIMAMRVSVLARNVEATVGHADQKSYQLGLSGVVGPFGDQFKRHAYTGLVRLSNSGGRREIPQ